MNECFSVELKQLVAESRKIALELGYNYISNIHFLLADCKFNKEKSIQKFCFKDDDEFKNFCERQRIDVPTIFGDSINGKIQITKDAEKTVRLCFKKFDWRKEKNIEPHHLFLAASSYDSSFAKLFPNQKNLYNDLLEYYVATGLVKGKEKDDIFIRIQRLFKSVTSN